MNDFLAEKDTLKQVAATRTKLVSILSSVRIIVNKWAANHADLLGTAKPLHHRRLTEIDVVSTLA